MGIATEELIKAVQITISPSRVKVISFFKTAFVDSSIAFQRESPFDSFPDSVSQVVG